MSRFMTILFVLFAAFIAVNAAPLSGNETVTEELEKRVTHTGRGTWFNVGLGNCGKYNKDSDLILAISKARYDANNGANCGQWVEIINQSNGKKAYGLTRDSCESCGWGDLDFSPSLFKKLDSLDKGVLKIKWHFMAKSWSP